MAAATPSRLRGTVDLLVDGTNLTARLPDVDRASFFCDLARITDDLCERRSHRASVRCHAVEGPWELGLERVGTELLVSLFRGGPRPEVALFERRVELAAFVAAIGSALDELGESGRSRLAASSGAAPAPYSEPATVEVAAEGDSIVRLSAAFGLRPRTAANAPESTVERANLFGLLVRGTLNISIGDRTRGFPETFVFLFAEQLLGVAAEAFDAWEQGRSYNRRTDLAGISLGIRSIAETKGAQPESRVDPLGAGYMAHAGRHARQLVHRGPHLSGAGWCRAGRRRGQLWKSALTRALASPILRKSKISACRRSAARFALSTSGCAMSRATT